MSMINRHFSLSCYKLQFSNLAFPNCFPEWQRHLIQLFFPPQPWKILNLKPYTFEIEEHCLVFMRYCNDALRPFDVAR